MGTKRIGEDYIIPFTRTLSKFSPRQKAHKAAKLSLHFCLSLASTLAVFQLAHPSKFLSFSTVLLPCGLWPSSCYLTFRLPPYCCLAVIYPSLLRMYPCKFYLLLPTSQLILINLTIPITLSLVNLCCHLIFRILLRLCV